MNLKISNQVSIPLADIQFQAIRAQGAGGQNVNKVSSAVHLRFDIGASSLPETYKESLKKINDRRITSDGIIIIKAQRFRSQEKNRGDALDRLGALIRAASVTRQRRKPTKPTRSSQRKRVDSKTKRGQLKSRRGRVDSANL
ncbi:MAG: alternative ribosome rescue aminoacyl-tRNA hydrolase ArfB [Halioglobus sp.]|jgi:ribosome-associated protein|uniref:alternative ribosome rescue aminoacyl-tRNA hydrolase ArfB n=1 Tax=Halioglobus sp. Uisw_031 TaxID=3230977 RepID=UPI0035905E11